MWTTLPTNDPAFRRCPVCNGPVERFTLTDEAGTELHVAERCYGGIPSIPSHEWFAVYLSEFAHLAFPKLKEKTT